MSDLKPVPASTRQELVRLMPDMVGLGGLACVCAGVYLLWGTGWTLIALGGPLVGAYLWRELRQTKRRRG